jgi:hypothetical protein
MFGLSDISYINQLVEAPPFARGLVEINCKVKVKGKAGPVLN